MSVGPENALFDVATDDLVQELVRRSQGIAVVAFFKARGDKNLKDVIPRFWIDGGMPVCLTAGELLLRVAANDLDSVVESLTVHRDGQEGA